MMKKNLILEAGKVKTCCTIGKFVRDLLREQRYYDTLFPRIPVPVQRDLSKRLEDYERAHPIKKKLTKEEPVEEIIVKESNKKDRSPKPRDRSDSKERLRERRSRSNSRHRGSRSPSPRSRSRSPSHSRRHRDDRSYDYSPERSRDARKRKRSRSPHSRSRSTSRERSRKRSRSPVRTSPSSRGDSPVRFNTTPSVVSSNRIAELEKIKLIYGATNEINEDENQHKKKLKLDSCEEEIIVLGSRK